MNYIWIFIGGGLGSIVRYELGQRIIRIAGNAFPFATLMVNMISCFVLGLLIACLIKREIAGSMALLFIGTGFCGGFSTFSTFTAENFEMMKSGNYVYVSVNIILSVVICLCSFWAGTAVSRLV
jgi:CrcB protein